MKYQINIYTTEYFLNCMLNFLWHNNNTNRYQHAGTCTHAYIHDFTCLQESSKAVLAFVENKIILKKSTVLLQQDRYPTNVFTGGKMDHSN